MQTFLNSLPIFFVCLLVCLAKIIEISIQSLKTVFMVKGKRVRAALLAFCECMVWGLVISSIIATLSNNIFLLVFYCLGYALGIFLGSMLEERIAIGTTGINVIASEENTKIITDLFQQEKVGYTVLDGHGAKDKVNVIICVIPRKKKKFLLKKINSVCDGVFEISSEIGTYSGGYGLKK